MEHKRQRVQFGWLDLKKRRNGPEVWVLRYRETLPDGSKRVPSVIVPETVNLLLNPSHKRAAKFRITDVFPYPFDLRLKR